MIKLGVILGLRVLGVRDRLEITERKEMWWQGQGVGSIPVW